MSQKNMVMNIVLKGDVDADFYQLGSELSMLGETIDQIGSKVRGFEKESLEIYKNYETYMLEAKGALTAQYESQSELERVMRGLDEHAQGWAASTIFDTRDVAKAISEAAHAGWTYEEMISGIPQAMLLAQAGNLSLADGMNYLIKALNATGTEFEDGGLFIDQWVKAANSGATTVGQLGDAIIRMGGTSQFTGSNAEMFTLLAVLADIGTIGPDAGTALRNSMLRLVAPTAKASTMMETLGITTQEYYDLAADEAALKNANALLEQTGFSAYDADGNLKPFLETYKDLYSAVSGMSEVDKNEVLAAIFPSRTLGSALGILEAASRGYDGLYEKIYGSEGYAQTIADIQTSGLMGAHAALESKWEEYSRKVGEILAPLETTGAQILGDFIDGLNNLDEVSLNALTGAMTAISLAGPALATVGGAIKLLSALGPHGAGLLVTVAALGAAAGALTKISEINLESTFGNLELDTEKLGQYVDGIETKFDIENSKVSQYATALQTANTNYLTLTQTLQEDMLSASLTGKTLTQEEIISLTNLGRDIGLATLDGIKAAKGESLSFLEAIFGDAEEGTAEAQALKDATDWTNSRFDSLYSQAANIGAQIRNSMVAALEDGTLNAAEQAAIDASIARLNEIQAEIASRMSRQEYLTQLKKAQSISWDSLESYLGDNAKKQEEDLAAAQELYFAQWGQTLESWEHDYAKATTDEERKALEDRWANYETQLEEELEETNKSIWSKYSELDYAAFRSAMRGSEHIEALDFLWQVWKSGNVSAGTGGWDFGGADLTKFLQNGTSAQEMIDALYGLYKFDRKKGISDELSASDSWISDMLDSAYDAHTQLRFDSSTIAMNNDATGDAEAYTEEAQEALDENPGNLAVNFPDGYTDGVTYVEGFQSGVDSRKVSLRVAGGSGGSSGGGSSGGSSSSGSTSAGRWLNLMYAEGGRATQASIFGEAGPEWAIPEEHSTRTADLLNLARQASGFTWGELINRYGGLNGSAGGTPLTLTYAPTIHAGDADGVEHVLSSDKARLMAMLRTMMEEAKMRDDAEVYA